MYEDDCHECVCVLYFVLFLAPLPLTTMSAREISPVFNSLLFFLHISFVHCRTLAVALSSFQSVYFTFVPVRDFNV